MTGELRGNAKEGYRGHFECPHCQKKVHLSASADLVRKAFVLWPVNARGDYTPADLAALDYARANPPKTLGLPEQLRGRTHVPEDPIPAFTGAQGT